MESKLGFFDKRNGCISQKKDISSSNELDSNIKILAYKLADGFLKDKIFFDDLERELLVSLSNLSEGNISCYDTAKKSTRSPLLDKSLSNLKKSYKSFNKNSVSDVNYAFPVVDENNRVCGSDFDKNNVPVASSVLSKKENIDYKKLNSSLENNSENSASFDQSKVTTNYSKLYTSTSVTGDFVDELDDCLEKSFKADYDNYIKPEIDKDPVLNNKLSEDVNDSTNSNFSRTLNDFDNIISFKKNKEENNVIFKDDLKNIAISNDVSSRSLQTSGFHLSNQSERKIETSFYPENDVDDSLKLDINDIEKELFSVASFPKGVPHSGEFSFDNQEKFGITSEGNSIIFDSNKIINFNRLPEVLNDNNMPIPSLFDDEKACIDNMSFNYDKVDNDYSFQNVSNGIKRDNLRSDTKGYEDLNFNNDVYSGEDLTKIELSTTGNKHDKGVTIIRSSRFWLIGYVTVIIILGFYWFFQLHREVEYYTGNTHIISAIKDPVQIIPSESEDDISDNQVSEVYDRVTGKKPSSPKQTRLLDSQEKPVDLYNINKDKRNHVSSSIVRNNIKN
ncbi:hypothetical protein [Candidatus Liberibacter americanus]|uniref:Uncharacterized protein n=1 Tax=Candidatus Liberibacter americanus str. Sao Paulo TaxID=1261131 RepID=U6B585_9HYPH|nr:hypothetical protein [Candidatus Liberibacter americanus]AHA28209.1 hypothetical protein lam_876 [Candidatus Liberibacter americanus str. Sao Paulo]EMS36277.1 hypothetical protein G653_02589 [Candidatus Liberibacter americanus PW_SP]